MVVIKFMKEILLTKKRWHSLCFNSMIILKSSLKSLGIEIDNKLIFDKHIVSL